MVALIRTVGIYGLGMMGGSLAQLIRQQYPDMPIYGYDTDARTVAYAKTEGTLTVVASALSQWPRDVSLVFVCTPMAAVIDGIHVLDDYLDAQSILTDISSVKQFCQGRLPSHRCVVSGHPMAGKSEGGIWHADAHCLRGATYFLQPNSHNRYVDVVLFLRSLTFNLVEISAKDHDQLVAASSHFPYLMACLTVQTAGSLPGPSMQQGISSGFKDTTRLAQSPVQWGVDVCHLNRDHLLVLLEKMREQAQWLQTMILTNNLDELTRFFEGVQSLRKELVI